MKIVRINQLEKYIKEKKSVSMKELYNNFDVSENTIRRDLKEILKRGEIKKIYGGVMSVENETQFIPYEKREVLHKDVKMSIALRACEYVENDDIIYIDSGTTTVQMIEGLKGKNVTILTNNLNFIIAAMPYKNLKIICLFGILDREMNSFVDTRAVDIVKEFNIKKAFLATTGISYKGKITNSLTEESKIKKSVISKSQQVFLLMDSSKFHKIGLVSYADYEDIDYIITEKIEKEYKEYLLKNNITVDLINIKNK